MSITELLNSYPKPLSLRSSPLSNSIIPVAHAQNHGVILVSLFLSCATSNPRVYYVGCTCKIYPGPDLFLSLPLPPFQPTHPSPITAITSLMFSQLLPCPLSIHYQDRNQAGQFKTQVRLCYLLL